jgi:FKBP-type peptidyl-prolyl cis-trans isomerase 2
MVKSGQKVKVHYAGTLADGTEFDNSYKRGEPIEFVAGVGQVVPGFDEAVLSLEMGEKKTVNIPAAQAYGVYDEARVEVIPFDEFPNAQELPVGQYIVVPSDDSGGYERVKVQKIEDGQIYFDFNHQLAGKDLTFELELISVEDIVAPDVPAPGQKV